MHPSRPLLQPRVVVVCRLRSLPLSLGVYCMVSNPGHCNRRDRIIEQTVVTDQRLARAHGGNDVRTCTDPIRSEASSSTDHMRATRCTVYMSLSALSCRPSLAARNFLTQATNQTASSIWDRVQSGRIHRLSA